MAETKTGTRSRIRIQLTGLLLMLWLPVAAAIAAGEMYQGRAVIADRSQSEQERGTQAALAQVLQKISGLGSFEERPEVNDALASARKMVVAFYFQNLEVMLPDGSVREDLQLVANFSPRAVDELRVQLQLPRWKPDRRPLNAWPVVDDGLERRILPIELQYAWSAMARLAEDRGMPVNWPEADEEGVYPVDVQLLWGGYTEELEESGPSEILVIAALQDGPEWNVRMNLDYEGLAWSERYRGNELELLLSEGLTQAIDQIAASSSIAASELGAWSVDITVAEILNADDYARCLAYLQSLSVVEQVTVKSAVAGVVQFTLALNAAPDYLQQYLAAGKKLLPADEEGFYQLLP